VGGAGVHWNGQCWRFLPSDFVARTHLEQRYGKDFVPPGMTIQDWGVTYDELEPYYDRFEYVCGVSGKAGNLQGAKQEGGNPFEGARRREYPLPPLARSYGTSIFDKAAREAGFQPFPCPAANTSKPWRNPYGVQMGQCTYCGFCEWFGCGNYSKASPQTTILPVLLGKDNFRYRTLCNVTRVNTDASGRRATGVSYVDINGREFEQPAELVLAGAAAVKTPEKPVGFRMPAFDWKLDDDDVAAVVNYIRNEWGNRAPGIDAKEVAKVRDEVLQTGGASTSGG